jgi:hypothetical protein
MSDGTAAADAAGEDAHWSEAKYFWGPLCGALALLVIFIIVMIEVCLARRKAAAGESEEETPAADVEAVIEEDIAVEVECAVESAPMLEARADLGSMERICKDKNETMTLGIGSMGGSLDEYDDLMDDEAIWNEDGSFVVKPKYQAPKKQDLGPIELTPKAGEV